MTQPELKPCPFCGGQAAMMLNREDKFNLTSHFVIYTGGSYWVKCEDCQASTWVAKNVDDALAQWNQRTVDGKSND